ncbi:MAG: AAA family ATPase [Prevotellaceae bacterium]|jgi:DNA transposition AAA+ family ATPase|nr:AAA family ATPase [Prevotellaceae bacterium]
MITQELKNKVLTAIKERREMYNSDAKFAVTLGISAAQMSRIKSGDTDKVLSDANWISIARKLDVTLGNAPAWQTAKTPVFEFITAQMEMCQQNALSALLCDLSDIGKTYTAVHYAKTHKGVAYIDCSQVKSKQKLIRAIAKEFGSSHTGRYADVYADLVFYLRSLPTPFIVLDEAGDLDYTAFLELKALWNATEGTCGWYMMGADGLKEKMRRSIYCKKVGYTELFSRFGKRYGKCVPVAREESEKMLAASAAMIIRANQTQDTGNQTQGINVILRKCMGEDNMPSLRRIYKELSKINN